MESREVLVILDSLTKETGRLTEQTAHINESDGWRWLPAITVTLALINFLGGASIFVFAVSK